MRHELGQRERAELALGQLAVMLEGIVRQPGARMPRRAGAGDAFHGERMEIRHVSVPVARQAPRCAIRVAPPICASATMRLSPKPCATSQSRDGGRRASRPAARMSSRAPGATKRRERLDAGGRAA